MTESSTSGVPSYGDVLFVLHKSHDRLVDTVAPLSADQVTRQSYDDEWSIAQVASHLGSGAEIFELIVQAGISGGPSPGQEQLQQIWDTWNAKSPTDQAHDAVEADARLLATLDGLTDDDHAGWHLEFFGAEQSPVDIVRLRLSEHAVHTWDIAVALDPSATVDEDASAVIIDNLPWLVSRVAKGLEEPTTVLVSTTAPERRLALRLGATGGELTTVSGDQETAPTTTLDLPGEAFVRLAYGRLDADHTPESVATNGIDLDVLRRTFPGI